METIINLATPYGKGALAVIRLSGAESLAIVQTLLKKPIEAEANRVFFRSLYQENGDVIDQVVLTYFQAPASFTGEDVVEISCHGSMVIVQEILAACVSKGARLAERGEFSSRAFYHGKMDLIQASAIQTLIDASSYEAKKASLFSLTGATSKRFRPMKDQLGKVLAHIEVNIDYPEYEDIEQMTHQAAKQSVKMILFALSSLMEDSEQNAKRFEGVRVGFFGVPNAGKSSLLNALLEEDKAIVTDIPGTTRDIVEGSKKIRGILFHFLDTAGIRESEHPIEKLGIEKAKALLPTLDLAVLVLDGSKEEHDPFVFALTEGMKRIVVYNKMDIVQKRTNDAIWISAKEKAIEELKDALVKESGVEVSKALQPSLYSARERGLLRQAKSALVEAEEALNQSVPLDLVAVPLKAAYDAFARILGDAVDVDVTKEVFAHFCVGK